MTLIFTIDFPCDASRGDDTRQTHIRHARVLYNCLYLFIYLYTVGLLIKIKLQGGMTAIAAEAFG